MSPTCTGDPHITAPCPLQLHWPTSRDSEFWEKPQALELSPPPWPVCPQHIFLMLDPAAVSGHCPGLRLPELSELSTHPRGGWVPHL